jgi:transcription elongation factor GreA
MSSASPVELTADGMQQLTGDLQALRERRENLIALLAESPDDAGTDLQTDLALADRRIAELQDILARARPFDAAERVPGVVSLGSRVTVDWEMDGEESYTIVDPAEIAPSDGRISDESPVGRALIGRRVGDRVAVETLGGATWLTIKSVD